VGVVLGSLFAIGIVVWVSGWVIYWIVSAFRNR